MFEISLTCRVFVLSSCSYLHIVLHAGHRVDPKVVMRSAVCDVDVPVIDDVVAGVVLLETRKAPRPAAVDSTAKGGRPGKLCLVCPTYCHGTVGWRGSHSLLAQVAGKKTGRMEDPAQQIE